MADWGRLAEYLTEQSGTEVSLDWAQLSDLVGGLPASAGKHRAWWSGDRPHVRAWRSAGYRVAQLDPGNRVAFVRADAPSTQQPERAEGGADLVLVTCVKSKRSSPAAAKDLYTSPLFRSERAYAEATGLPWFILSAEHGLVAPDEWLAPYERYLPTTPPSYRSAWGRWVAARLELLAGSLKGKVVEIHASATYVEAARPCLEEAGAQVVEPLHGLAMGERLAWYLTRPAAPREPAPVMDVVVDPSMFIELLLDEETAVEPSGFLAGDRQRLSTPGLYSWWVDESGAHDLSRGLGQELDEGLIYAGLAGATRWPSGKRSTNTLWSRIAGMHLGGRHEFSTFRRSLGAILAGADGSDEVDESALSDWMHRHLRVIAVPYEDADTLGKLEKAMLEKMDPPLNLQGMAATPVRRRLTELRRVVS